MSDPAPIQPIPMIIVCVGCGQQHIDEGAFATRPHRTHHDPTEIERPPHGDDA